MESTVRLFPVIEGGIGWASCMWVTTEWPARLAGLEAPFEADRQDGVGLELVLGGAGKRRRQRARPPLVSTMKSTTTFGR